MLGRLDHLAALVHVDHVLVGQARQLRVPVVHEPVVQKGRGPKEKSIFFNRLWFQFQERVTTTDERDLLMSGDHRKY